MAVDQFSKLYEEIKDLLTGDPNNTQAINDKITKLSTLRGELINSGISSELKSDQLVAIDQLANGLACIANLSGARRSARETCDASSVELDLENAYKFIQGKIVFDENHIIEADAIVSRHFVFGNNLDDIYNKIYDDAKQIAVASLNTHFKDGTPADLQNFVGICVSIWLDHIAASAISLSEYNKFKTEINNAPNSEAKAINILKRGVIAREKVEFFVFVAETVYEIITMASGTHPGLGNSLSNRRAVRPLTRFSLNNSLDNELKVFYLQKKARQKPGTGTGNGTQVDATNWLQGSEKEWGHVPTTIANALRGQHFKTFDELRVAFWKLVGNDPNLRTNFKASDFTECVITAKPQKQ